MWPGTPQQNGAIFAVTVRMDSNARPTAGTGGAVAATPVLDCDAAERELEFTVTTRTEPLTLPSKAPDRSGWRGAPGRPKEPTVRAEQAGACTIGVVHQPHAHHSSPHPRPVQLLLIDQQIASALPLAQ
jgi:hypothetical protein